MLDITQEYALLEDGEIEELFDGFQGKPKQVIEENGEYFLLTPVKEELYSDDTWTANAELYRKRKILATANNIPWLDQHRREIMNGRN